MAFTVSRQEQWKAFYGYGYVRAKDYRDIEVAYVYHNALAALPGRSHRAMAAGAYAALVELDARLAD